MRLNSATPKAGNGFELDAIASCFIGGASTTGGIGTVVGAIVGGLLMGVLNNGMSILGVSIDWQQAIKGIVLLAAVAFDVYSSRNLVLIYIEFKCFITSLKYLQVLYIMRSSFIAASLYPYGIMLQNYSKIFKEVLL